MTELPENLLHILKNKLQKEFIPLLPELLNKERPKADQDKKQLSRAFSGFVLHKMLEISVAEAAQAVVDDFDDNGLDAIYYKSTDKTLYLVQAKFRERVQFDEDDAIRFRNGVELLLGQKYNRFNANVKRRSIELDNVFDEAKYIQLIVAYIGSGFSLHANDALKELTESEDHHEIGRLQAKIEEYGPEKIKVDILAEQSTGTVETTLRLQNFQSLAGQRDTHFGIALVSDLVELHRDNQKALYERNIRYFLGVSESGVNRSIQETLRTAPDEFFYLNNGITALADEIDQPKGTKTNRSLKINGLSVINGAQTISSAADFVAQNPSCDISAAKVLVTIIKADSDGAFGRSITRARNHQNPVSTSNFASLDPRQENLRREVAYFGYSYHYRPEAMPHNSEVSTKIITIEQAIKALALFEIDSRYPYWLKNEVSRLQNSEATEYGTLFNSKLTGAQLVNKVKFFRFVRHVLSDNASATKGAEGLFYKHGTFVIATVLAMRCRAIVNRHDILKQAQINRLLSDPLDKCRQSCWEIAESLIGQGRSVLAFFQNQGHTVNLLNKCMAIQYALDQTDAYINLTRTSTKEEAFPKEKLFRYLISKAPQLEANP